MSANLVEICDSLGNLDLCVLHLKRTMHGDSKPHINGFMRMAFSNDIIRTATLAHVASFPGSCACAGSIIMQCGLSAGKQKLTVILV